MTWFGYVLIVWWVIAVVLTVAQVGKPRKPLEPSVAAIAVLIYLALGAGVLFVGTGQLP